VWTTVIIRWVGAQTLPDGAPYENHGVHIVRLRWGKVVPLARHCRGVFPNQRRQERLSALCSV
jgi:ketosteroid isomerase-like protein